MTSSSEPLAARARAHLVDSAEVKRRAADECLPSILAGGRLIADTLRNGGKVLLCGNGGSAADCQHVAAEFVSRLSKELERAALAAIALTTDTSILTAYANDYSFAGVFARQVEALGRPGDLLIGISTSGGADNVLLAIKTARQQGLQILTLTGPSGPMGEQADVAIRVPSMNTQFVQETHLAVEHILCDLAEQELFAST
jgi:D-sedoheptulose 7-phosphate isomerase